MFCGDFICPGNSCDIVDSHIQCMNLSEFIIFRNEYISRCSNANEYTGYIGQSPGSPYSQLGRWNR